MKHSSTLLNNSPRLLHQLPRSGGTVINRCIGTMRSLIVLSEIHPMDINRANQFNPIVQANRWFRLLNSEERIYWRQKLKTRTCNFVEAIDFLHNKAQQHDAYCLIREYSHRDYIKTPLTKPCYFSRSAELLGVETPLLRCSLVRHPLAQWRSFEEYPALKGRCQLQDF